MAANVTVTMNDAGLRHLLRNPEGPVGRHIERVGGRVDQLATDFATGTGPGPGPKIRTQDLINSIKQFLVQVHTGELQTDIVADARHNGINYPALQERGGIAPNGARYRFPFLEPALAASVGQTFRR